jgi:hypothetical protein
MNVCIVHTPTVGLTLMYVHNRACTLACYQSNHKYTYYTCGTHVYVHVTCIICTQYPLVCPDRVHMFMCTLTL